MSSSDEDIEKSLKRKKKKKVVKKKAESDDEGSDAEASPKPVKQREEQKEKKAVVSNTVKQDAPKNDDSDFETLEAFYAHLKATKKRKKKQAAEVSTGVVDWEALQKTDRDYTYPEILSRVYDRIKANNPQLGVKTVYKIRPPNVVRDGTKKVAFTNFAEICKSLNRNQEHVFNYTVTELGTSGNIDGNNCLILRGRLNTKHIEGLLRKYIDAYVTCSMCHSTDTRLVKDPHSRLTTLQCNQCNASRTVQSITGGFSAQIGRRRRR